MITPHFLGGAAAAAIRPPRRITRLLTLLLLFASLAVTAPTASLALEPSAYCADDNDHPSIQLVSGDFGLPLWLGVESGLLDGDPGHVGICYATGGPSEPKTLGGTVMFYSSAGLTGAGGRVYTRGDSNSASRNDTETRAYSTYSLSPGGASGGQAVSFQIPFSVCSGTCYTTPGGGLATTGLILGTLTQKSAPGGISLAYQVSKLCLMVNGIPVTDCTSEVPLPGATTTGNLPVNVGTGGATPGPCVVGVCIPSIDYVGTSGRQLATVYVPGLSSIPLYGVRACAYQRDAQTPCPS